MKYRTAFKVPYTVIFAVLVFAIRVLADDVPTFSDPDVNVFLKSWSQNTESLCQLMDEIVTNKAIDASDMSTVLALQSRAEELAAQAARIARKLKPDEKEKFMGYWTQCNKNFDDAKNRLIKYIGDSSSE